MGLGKTVQTVALIAALLKKTGTQHDRFVLRRRQILAKERAARIQHEQEKCLRAGCPHYDTTKYIDVAKEVGLPEMAPIIVVAPKGVGEKERSCFLSFAYVD